MKALLRALVISLVLIAPACTGLVTGPAGVTGDSDDTDDPSSVDSGPSGLVDSGNTADLDAAPAQTSDASPDSGPDVEPGTGIAIYWGQNGWGGAHPGDPDSWEPPLVEVCQDPAYDIILLSFVTSFVSARNADGLPETNFSYHCETPLDDANPFLLRCPEIEAGIEACHARGKRVLLSLGGAAGSYGFTGDAQAEQFADTVWDLFLGGNAAPRPFGSAILDGVDLDIEGGGVVGYSAFVNRLRARMDSDPARSYYITAAPQCPFPDAFMGPAPGRPLGDVPQLFDYVFVQFYNNYCNYNQLSSFEAAFQQWAALYEAGGPELYVGLPATPEAAQAASFVSREDLSALVAYASTHEGFAGIMLWDVSYDQNSDEGGETYGALAARLVRDAL